MDNNVAIGFLWEDSNQTKQMSLQGICGTSNMLVHEKQFLALEVGAGFRSGACRFRMIAPIMLLNHDYYQLSSGDDVPVYEWRHVELQFAYMPFRHMKKYREYNEE